MKETTLRENYKEACELWRKRNPMTRINTDAKLLLNLKNYILKAKRITTVENDEIKEKYRSHTKRMNATKWIQIIKSTSKKTRKRQY
jgi:hypothetical protein